MNGGETSERIGFIGLGMMGGAIAEILAADGRTLTVWNREPEPLDALARKGAKVADSPAEVAANSDIVLLCVLHTDAVNDVVFGPDGVATAARANTYLVDHSTAMPKQTAAMAQDLHARTGMAWIDAPVSGGPGFARERRLTIMAGGEAADFEAVRPLMATYAQNITLMGPAGAGQMTKVINQALSGVGYVLMAEALRLAEESGIDAARVPECLAGGHADSTMLHFAYPKMLAREFDPPASFASQMLKDLKNVMHEAGDLALDLPLIDRAREQFSRYVDAGGGRSETASIYRLYSDRS